MKSSRQIDPFFGDQSKALQPSIPNKNQNTTAGPSLLFRSEKGLQSVNQLQTLNKKSILQAGSNNNLSKHDASFNNANGKNIQLQNQISVSDFLKNPDYEYINKRNLSSYSRGNISLGKTQGCMINSSVQEEINTRERNL